MKRVAVLDYGSGNVHSVTRALAAAGAEVTLSADYAYCLAADGLVVPGVGAFAACMAGLEAVTGVDLVRERFIAARPILGICVGHQVMFAEGVEHGVATAGIGLLPGVVARLQAHPLPHMGWNVVNTPSDSLLFSGVGDERFYFVHSYGVREATWVREGSEAMSSLLCQGSAGIREATEVRAATGECEADFPLEAKVTWASHASDSFVAALEYGSLWTTQFHPEKSGDSGARLLRNWIATL